MLPEGGLFDQISQISQILTKFSNFANFDPNQIKPNFNGGAKSEGKVLQHDGDADSRTCSRNPSRARGRADEQTPTLICDSGTRRILRAAAIWGGFVAPYEQRSPPQIYYYDISNLITPKKFTTPTKGFGRYFGRIWVFDFECRNPPFQKHPFPMKLAISN